jgi:hypothetical protein
MKVTLMIVKRKYIGVLLYCQMEIYRSWDTHTNGYRAEKLISCLAYQVRHHTQRRRCS